MGVLVGAGLYYYLSATEEGKKLHRKVRQKTLEGLGELVDEIEKKGQEFKKKAQQVQDKLGKETDQQLDHIKQLRERGRRAVNFFTSKGKPLG